VVPTGTSSWRTPMLVRCSKEILVLMRYGSDTSISARIEPRTSSPRLSRLSSLGRVTLSSSEAEKRVWKSLFLSGNGDSSRAEVVVRSRVRPAIASRHRLRNCSTRSNQSQRHSEEVRPTTSTGPKELLVKTLFLPWNLSLSLMTTLSDMRRPGGYHFERLPTR